MLIIMNRIGEWTKSPFRRAGPISKVSIQHNPGLLPGAQAARQLADLLTR